MSFLSAPRFAFAGRFLSDVSTINNLSGDVGWNPQGGAAFEFLGCRVSGGWLSAAAAEDDPVLGYAVSGRPGASSAKMVDLDPDWRMASQLWGLSVRLFDPATGELAFIGRYDVAAFRDLWLRQVAETLAGNLPNGQPMGARYVSTLREVEWGPAAERSPLLSRLRAASAAALQISFHQFGYFYATDHPRYRTGALVGLVGPTNAGTPATVLVARRLQAAMLNPRTAAVGPIDVEVAADGNEVAMDLGHALPLDNADGALTELGRWPALPQLAGCRTLALGLAAAGFTAWGKPAGPVELFGEVDPFAPGWYPSTGGVVSFPLAPGQLSALRAAALGLYGRLDGGDLVAITREVDGGLFVRADRFVQRMEPGGRATVTLHARRYGAPAAGVKLYLSPQQPPTPPALTFPAEVTTGADGAADARLAASDPGAPRKGEGAPFLSPDGQVYILDYSPLAPIGGAASRTGTGLGNTDVIAVHLRQQVAVPDAPTWEADVQPILADYAALYPIMSKHLFDIADYDAVVAHRRHLLLAFGRNIEDPNYMPVTRDLSEGKRSILLKWLAAETGDPQVPLPRGPATAQAPVAAAPSLAALVAHAPGPADHDAKRDDVEPLEPSFGEGRSDD